MDGTSLDARYWYDSLRGQVRFDQVISGLAKAGHGTFIEASPHPVLTVPVQDVLDEAGCGGRGLPGRCAARRADRFSC